MLRIIGSVLRALKTAVLSIWSLAWEILLAPLKILWPAWGRSAVPPPALPLPEAEADLPGEALTPSDVAPRLAPSDAALAILWASDALAGTVLPAPKTLAPTQRAWLENLTVPQRRALVQAGHETVAAHMAGRAAIPGVPAVLAHEESAGLTDDCIADDEPSADATPRHP